VDVHSDHLLAAQRQGELISAARKHELARAASAGRPGVAERLRQLRLTLHVRREPAPADRPYVRTWVTARSTGTV
jgi:hypothetical protein